MGARSVRMAILRADGNLRAPRLLGECRDQGRRRTDQKIALGRERRRARDHRLELGDRGPQPVHLPVARDQRAARGHVRIPIPVLMKALANRPWARQPVLASGSAPGLDRLPLPDQMRGTERRPAQRRSCSRLDPEARRLAALRPAISHPGPRFSADPAFHVGTSPSASSSRGSLAARAGSRSVPSARLRTAPGRRSRSHTRSHPDAPLVDRDAANTPAWESVDKAF